MIPFITFAGPIVLNQAEEGRLLEALIYFPLIYLVLPALFLLWVIYFFKHFAKHQKTPKLLRLNIISTITVMVIYLTASPIIEIVFGKLES